MGTAIKPGMLVFHPNRPKWGPGRVMEISGDIALIVFRDYRVLKAIHICLTMVQLEIADCQHDEVLDSIPDKVTPYEAISNPTKCANIESDRETPDESAGDVPAIELKKDWEKCSALLMAKGIDRLYHITDRANLASIKKIQGLLSWFEAQRLGVYIPRPGGSDRSREFDVSRGLQNYVRLNFVPDPPMLFALKQDGRLEDPVVLEIDPVVALWRLTLFSTGNAASFKDVVRVGGEFDVLERVHFDLIRARHWNGNEEKLLYQAEVMVHQFLPLQFIKNGV